MNTNENITPAAARRLLRELTYSSEEEMASIIRFAHCASGAMPQDERARYEAELTEDDLADLTEITADADRAFTPATLHLMRLRAKLAAFFQEKKVAIARTRERAGFLAEQLFEEGKFALAAAQPIAEVSSDAGQVTLSAKPEPDGSVRLVVTIPDKGLDGTRLTLGSKDGSWKKEIEFTRPTPAASVVTAELLVPADASLAGELEIF